VGFLQYIHGRFALACILFALLLAVWGSYQFLRYRRVSGGFRSSYLLLIALAAVQGIVGAVLLLGGRRPQDWPLHIVYGIFAVAFLPAMYFYSERRNDLREAAFLAASCWVVVVAFGRGLTTG
jgi:drug/metabolite transporter (DMT)-like permease